MSITRWGIVGAGVMAELFVQALQSLPGAKIEAVASRTQDGANKFAAQFGIPKAVEGYDRLLQETAVDVVYISTPNEFHCDHSLKAIAAGKAVLCEKPFALTAAEAKQVIDLARAKKVFCMEALWTRFSPAFREALEVSKSGKLGDLRFFSGQLGFPYVADPANRLFRQPGGGALLDLGVYPLSLAQALFGTPVRVRSVGVDEQFSAVLEYKSGVQALIAASLKAKLGNSASIHGSDRILQLAEPLYFPESYTLIETPKHGTGQRGGGKLSKLRRLPVLRNVADAMRKSKTQTIDKRTSESGYTFEAAEVQRCLAAGLLESPEMPLSDSLAVMETVDSIRARWAD